ncbi:hypothetical protein ACTWPT_26970 [Nonomuraea sp. 3N208]|uniref:hypothetical protein n=1 Tax=Nonomuraea sp. 3N208 TaxID=3457421 RepID=UPI003FD46CC9
MALLTAKPTRSQNSPRASALPAHAEGRAQMLGDFGPHLTAAGEGWIVIRPTLDAQGGPRGHDWYVPSVVEVIQQGSRLTAEIEGMPVTIPAHDADQAADPDDPIAIRV